MSAELCQALGALMGKGVTRDVMRGFAMMEIAEEEILDAYPRVDNKPSDPSGLFKAASPPTSMRHVSDRVYRHHVRELIRRSRGVVADYSLATDAEVLLAMMRTATATPLNHGGMLIAERLFESVFAGHRFETHTEEEWSGQYAEELHAARRMTPTGREGQRVTNTRKNKGR